LNKQVNDTVYKNDYYIKILAVEMNLSKRITKIDFNSTNGKFKISNNEEQIDEAETVIVTVPVPQVLTQLKGSIAQLIGNYKILLKIMLYRFFYLKKIIRISKTSLLKLNIQVVLRLVFFIQLQS